MKAQALTWPSFELPSAVLAAYSVLAFTLSAALLALSLRRGWPELCGWLVAYLLVVVVAALRPNAALLVAGVLAILLGFVRTYRHGYNLDLGLSLIALAAGVYVWRRARGAERPSIDLAGLALLSIAIWSLLSLAFTLVRIWSFRPAPGFGYHVFRFNLFGLPSDEAMARATLGGAAAFVWWGIYEYARSVAVKPGWLTVTVFVVLLFNGAALLVQRHVDPTFLHPVGLPLIDRLNGVTSFCYALGDVALALFLLLPIWGAARGLLGALSAANVVLLAHAVVASGSRSALLTALLASVLWGSVEAVRRFAAGGRRAAVLILALVLSLAGGAAITYWITPPDQATPLGRLKEGIGRQGVFGHLLATRLSSYPLAFRVLSEYPLAGVGVGLYPAEMDKQRALLAPDVPILEPYLLTSNAPNQFLNTGVELGLPAMGALALVFIVGGWAAWPRRGGRGSAALTISLFALVGALQFGPAFLNSEAVVFLLLIVGLAARSRTPAPVEGAQVAIGPRVGGAVLACVVVIGLIGQLLARPELAIESQWRRLRWRLNIGMQPPEPGGQWTSSEATFVVNTAATAVRVRWHAGDNAAKDYRAEVTFFVDGTLAEKSLVEAGRIRESLLPLPPAPGFKRISVRVHPAFVPAEQIGGTDERQLGVFLLDVLPKETGPSRRADQVASPP